MTVVRTCAAWIGTAVVAASCTAFAAGCDGDSTPTGPSASPSPTETPPAAPAPDPAPEPAPEPAPAPPPPRVVSFGAGRHRVGSDIQPGRYYADPEAGCYWERLSGFGGTTAERIAFRAIDFDAGQWIVDIAPSDFGFTTRPACGTWFSTPRHPARPSIPPGMWLVGTQVSPGVYQTSAAAGCYWERLRHFSGQPDGVIASELVGSPGPQFVTIAASDAGFRSDPGCGTWTRTQATR